MAERYDDHLIGTERSRKDNDDNSDTTAIRAEIAETRDRMSDTLDEIGHRLNPNVVKEQVTQRVKEGIREATIGRVEHMARTAVDKVNDTRYSLTDTVRDNPVPAAMVAIGLGWLMVNRRSSPDYSRERSLDSYREPSTNFGNAGMSSTGGAALGGAMLGDNAGMSGNRGGLESSGLGNTGGNTGASGYGSTSGRSSTNPNRSGYTNDLGTSSSDPSDLTNE